MISMMIQRSITGTGQHLETKEVLSGQLKHLETKVYDGDRLCILT